ncbi:BON domain-containing protein [Ensifer sp.]|jgi:osmotically-inducible protein OsmY|uniref:BON domain-containing protein n=1 Tax=Ensifer sp. TaxID=1872086 RepID=UPI002E100651|nr:BON domain-containing protein [Ensifer sp.]
MVFKKRTFYGDEPERLIPEQPAELERTVADLLAVVPGLDASDVTVTAKGNTILLAGFVASQDEVRRAEEAAEGVPGVAEVLNRIEVVAIRSN